MRSSYPSAIDAILASVRPEIGVDVLDVRVGPFWTVVRTTIGAGMASTMIAHQSLSGRPSPIDGAGSLVGRGIDYLLGLLRSESPAEAAVGLAAVNALTNIDRRRVREINARELLAERGAGRRLAVIGRFPFVDRLREVSREVWVFERGPARRPDDLGPEHVAELLPKAEVVALTATTLINHTFDELTAFIDPEAWVVMLGPSTPLTPCLFDFGINLLCGTVVASPDEVARAAGQGAVTSQIEGVCRVCLAPA